MNETATSKKRLNRIFFGSGMILQCLFLIAAICLFKERTLYADTAHFIAEITGTGGFYLGHRLVAVISRILPVTGSLLGASIPTSLTLYSINLALIFFLSYVLIAYKFKDRKMALVLLLFQFIFMYRTFYIPISELQHGLVFLILYWSYLFYLNKKGRRPSRNLLVYILLIFIMNTHPIILFAFVASCLILSEHEGYWRAYDQKLLVPSATLFYILSSIIFYTNYEAVILAQVLKTSDNVINIYHIRLMISSLLRNYYPAIAVGAVAAAMLLRKYSRKKALLIVLLIAVHAVLVYFRFANTTFNVTFFEIYLMPLPLMLFLVLAIQLHHFSRYTRMLGIAGVFILMVFQGYRIYQHKDFYQDRLEVYSNVLSQMEKEGISKAVLPFYEAPMHDIVDFYATPFESYLLSYLDENSNNDGFSFTYLPADSIRLEDATIHLYTYPDDTIHAQFTLKNDYFIALGIDTIDYFSFTRYKNFKVAEGPYQNINIVY